MTDLQIFESTNPYSGEVIAQYSGITDAKVQRMVKKSNGSWASWRLRSFESKAMCFLLLCQLLRENKESLARLITLEMGKRISESIAEIEKCAWLIEYYIENGESMLTDQSIPSDASQSFVRYQSLGPILAVMPWNFPFWQVLRFAVPTMLAGNTILLKHASNVQGCAVEIERLFKEAGFPEESFQTLIIGSSQVEAVILNPLVRGVSLTGSEEAGKSVGGAAGRGLKKSVLELGGSDPFIVCKDADLDEACEVAVKSRMLTSGQTCIAAKRFLVDHTIHDEFVDRILQKVSKLNAGNPLDPKTLLAPLAKKVFVTDLQEQITSSRRGGAKLITGAKTDESNFYSPTLLVNVKPAHRVFREETFGPVFSVTSFKNTHEAIALANDSKYGLGSSIWTQNRSDIAMALKNVQAGAIFVNGLVKSDPRLPFGGILDSGYGRELGTYGMRTFTNEKTVWIK